MSQSESPIKVQKNTESSIEKEIPVENSIEKKIPVGPSIEKEVPIEVQQQLEKIEKLKHYITSKHPFFANDDDFKCHGKGYEAYGIDEPFYFSSDEEN